MSVGCMSEYRVRHHSSNVPENGGSRTGSVGGD
jgi:hypothetical protein